MNYGCLDNQVIYGDRADETGFVNFIIAGYRMYSTYSAANRAVHWVREVFKEAKELKC